VTAEAPPRCPYSRHFSYATEQYSIQVGFDELTEIMDKVFEVWDSLKLDATNERIGDGFNELVEHIAGLREWTGWGGIPWKYLGETGPGAQ
jgi:hypothetical protein